MKKLITLFTFILVQQFLFAQVGVPEGATFSGIAYNSGGFPLTNDNINVRLGYLTSISPEVIQYRELHSNVATNIQGQFFVIAGQGTYTAGLVNSFSLIPWSAGPVYLKVEIDNGAGYVDVGTVRLWSSYYAFASKTAESIAVSGQNGQVLTYNNGQWSAASLPPISYDGNTGNVTLGSSSYTNPTAYSGSAYSEIPLTDTQRGVWIEDVNMQRSLPTGGSYIVVASARAWGLQPGEYATFRLYNATAGTAIGQAVIGANDGTGSFSNLATINAGDVIKMEYRVLPSGSNTQTFYLSGNTEGASSYSLIKVK